MVEIKNWGSLNVYINVSNVQMLQISNVYISNDQKLKSFKCVICRSLKTNLSVIRLPHNIRLPHCVTATSHTSTKCIKLFQVTLYNIILVHVHVHPRFLFENKLNKGGTFEDLRQIFHTLRIWHWQDEQPNLPFRC